MRYIIWTEGLNHRSGEKIKAIRRSYRMERVEYGMGKHTYETTTKITEALRVDEGDIEEVRNRLPDTRLEFIPTSYTPKGTLFDPKSM